MPGLPIQMLSSFGYRRSPCVLTSLFAVASILVVSILVVFFLPFMHSYRVGCCATGLHRGACLSATTCELIEYEHNLRISTGGSFYIQSPKCHNVHEKRFWLSPITMWNILHIYPKRFSHRYR
jgi:hypothetical protein